MKETQAPRRAGAGELERSYAGALALHLAGGGEDALRGAYHIGRQALAEGRSLLEVVAAHHAAMAEALRRRAAAPLQRDLDKAGEILCECLSPYEMAQSGFREAVQALRRLNETMENEIRRIAHAVHDEAGQLLVAARLAISGLDPDASPSIQGPLREVGAILDQAEKALRRLSRDLRPTILDDLGLVPALRFLAGAVSKGTSLSVHVESALEVRAAPSLETALYRVAQEALANAARHSGARSVLVRLTREGNGLRCLIRDDGVGFDVQAVLSDGKRGGLGLVGMRERLHAVGGTLRITSAPGRGTEILVRAPLET